MFKIKNYSLKMGDSKIKTLKELSVIAKKFKAQGEKIVLTHGVFDFIHWGHIHYLKEAKKYGDVLVVSVVNDKFINKSEVKKRPLVFTQKIRASWLAELQTVAYVVLADAPGPWKVMRALSPDFYVRGSDSKERLKNKNSGLRQDKLEIEKLGGKLVFINSLPIHSTDLLKQ